MTLTVDHRSARAVSISQSFAFLRSVKFQASGSTRGSRLPTFGTYRVDPVQGHRSRRAAQLDVTRLEVERLRLETFERARERRLVDTRPHRVDQPRIETLVGVLILLQHRPDLRRIVDDDGGNNGRGGSRRRRGRDRRRRRLLRWIGWR